MTRLERHPARPAAGPFRVLEAVGRRRAEPFEVTTRHRFGPTAIDERWIVRRSGGGRDAHSVVAQFPSWGTGASSVAVLRTGRTVPLAPGRAAVPLEAVRAFRIRSREAGYRVVLRGRPRGTVRAVPTEVESANPTPGPTLELEFASGKRFRRAQLAVRIVP